MIEVFKYLHDICKRERAPLLETQTPGPETKERAFQAGPLTQHFQL